MTESDLLEAVKHNASDLTKKPPGGRGESFLNSKRKHSFLHSKYRPAHLHQTEHIQPSQRQTNTHRERHTYTDSAHNDTHTHAFLDILYTSLPSYHGKGSLEYRLLEESPLCCSIRLQIQTVGGQLG